MKYLALKLMYGLFFSVALLFAQNTDEQGNSEFGGDPFGGDPFGGLTVDSLPPPVLETPPADTIQTSPQSSLPTLPEDKIEEENITPPTQSTQSSDDEQTPLLGGIESSDLESKVQNAVIEGIQITSEKGSSPDEKIISGYFIFRDKPSSYFYEVKLREKKIIFEFNDTKVGASPVPSVSEPPIKGFKIVSDKVDINKDVKGLTPEYHKLIRVIFDLEGIPEIHVNDEYSIITFSFKWSTNPQLISKYTVKDKTPKIILWSSVGIGGLGLGALGYFLLKPEDGTSGPGIIDIKDLPDRPTP